MICSLRGSDRVQWKGPLPDLPKHYGTPVEHAASERDELVEALHEWVQATWTHEQIERELRDTDMDLDDNSKWRKLVYEATYAEVAKYTLQDLRNIANLLLYAANELEQA